jgi:hypothetical protein
MITALQGAGLARYRTDPARAIELMQSSLDLRSSMTAGEATTRFMKAASHLFVGDEAGAAREMQLALPLQVAVGDTYYVTMSLGATAVLARRAGLRDVALRLLAFVERLREEGRIVGATRDLESQEQLRARLERELDPATREQAIAQGRALSLEEAVALAMDVLVPIAGDR